MSLALPGKIVDRQDRDGMQIGRVRFGDRVRIVCLDFVPEAKVGDYVMVHLGFATEIIDASEAERIQRAFPRQGDDPEDELPGIADGPPDRNSN